MTGMRIGQGFDLHHLKPGRAFVLGGVLLDWLTGPVGHSDGDVLVHATIDALLGAAGLGDIGDWFPPSDPQYAGANSLNLLQTVYDRLRTDHWQLINLDATVLLEAPKLSAMKPQIQTVLARALNADPSQISVKAKTMEGLGPIGQGETVAAWVSVLLQKRIL